MAEAVVDILTYHNYLVDAVSDGEADDYLPKPFAMGGAQDAPCRPSTVVTSSPFPDSGTGQNEVPESFCRVEKISACDKIARRVPYIRRLSL